MIGRLFSRLGGIPNFIMAQIAVMAVLPFWSLTFSALPWELVAEGSARSLLSLLSFWILPPAIIVFAVTRSFAFIPAFLLEAMALGYVILTIDAQDTTVRSVQVGSYVSLIFVSIFLLRKDTFFPLLSSVGRSWRSGARLPANSLLKLRAGKSGVALAMDDCSLMGMGVTGDKEALVQALGRHPKGKTVDVELPVKGEKRTVRCLVAWYQDQSSMRRLGLRAMTAEDLSVFVANIANYDKTSRLDAARTKLARFWVSTGFRRAAACIWVGTLATTHASTACKPKSASATRSLENFAAGETINVNRCSYQNPLLQDDEAMTKLFEPLIKMDITEPNEGLELRRHASKVMSALPMSTVAAFSALNGLVHLTKERPCAEEGTAACYVYEERGGKPRVDIYVRATPGDIDHSLIREFGYVWSEVFARIGMQTVANKTTASRTWIDHPLVFDAKVAVAAAYLADLTHSPFFDYQSVRPLLSDDGSFDRLVDNLRRYRRDKFSDVFSDVTFKLSGPGDSQTARLSAFISSVFAESFDSFFCNVWDAYDRQLFSKVLQAQKSGRADSKILAKFQASTNNSRAVMAALFPETHIVFAHRMRAFFDDAELDARILTYRKSGNRPRAVALQLADDAAESGETPEAEGGMTTTEPTTAGSEPESIIRAADDSIIVPADDSIIRAADDSWLGTGGSWAGWAAGGVFRGGLEGGAWAVDNTLGWFSPAVSETMQGVDAMADSVPGAVAGSGRNFGNSVTNVAKTTWYEGPAAGFNALNILSRNQSDAMVEAAMPAVEMHSTAMLEAMGKDPKDPANRTLALPFAMFPGAATDMLGDASIQDMANVVSRHSGGADQRPFSIGDNRYYTDEETKAQRVQAASAIILEAESAGVGKTISLVGGRLPSGLLRGTIAAGEGAEEAAMEATEHSVTRLLTETRSPSVFVDENGATRLVVLNAADADAELGRELIQKVSEERFRTGARMGGNREGAYKVEMDGGKSYIVKTLSNDSKASADVVAQMRAWARSGEGPEIVGVQQRTGGIDVVMEDFLEKSNKNGRLLAGGDGGQLADLNKFPEEVRKAVGDGLYNAAASGHGDGHPRNFMWSVRRNAEGALDVRIGKIDPTGFDAPSSFIFEPVANHPAPLHQYLLEWQRRYYNSNLNLGP